MGVLDRRVAKLEKYCRELERRLFYTRLMGQWDWDSDCWASELYCECDNEHMQALNEEVLNWREEKRELQRRFVIIKKKLNLLAKSSSQKFAWIPSTPGHYELVKDLCELSSES